MIIVLFLASFILPLLCAKEKTIRTPFGKIEGKKIKAKGGGSVTQYLGIPYAYPPTGSYRFKAPLKLRQPAWNKTYRAVHKAGACAQILRHLKFKQYDELLPENGTNENCLKLNMWVPKGKKLPVLVFFHDGFFSIRTASVERYYGATLASKSKSIVITTNFRLGFFGFSYLGNGSDILGNMGLLDQQKVLKWIRVAIESFGGNKNAITLVGVGSGGSSVSAHLFSEGSTGLFQRAIISSGTITNPLNTVTPKFAERNTRLVAKHLNCTGTIQNISSCLQKAKVTDILRATTKVSFPHNMTAPQRFLPILSDNVFFKGSLRDKLKDNTFNRNVDLIVGTTPDEATLLMAITLTNSSKYNCQFFPKRKITDEKNSCKMNAENYREVVRLARSILNLNTSEAKELFELYNDLPGLSYAKKSIKFLSDVLFNCEIFKFAIMYSKVSSGNFYFYQNLKRSPISKWPSWTGVMQGEEFLYIFGDPIRNEKMYDKKIRKKEKKYSENLISLISSFVKSGKPSKKWENFCPSNTKAVIFDKSLNPKKLEHKHVFSICPHVNRIILRARRRAESVIVVPTRRPTTTQPLTTTTKKKGVFGKIKSWFKKKFD